MTEQLKTYSVTPEEVQLERIRRKNNSNPLVDTLTNVRDVSAGVLRKGAGIVGGIADIATLPYNIYKGVKGEEGFSFQDKAKKGVDYITGSVAAPTTSKGKLADEITDYIGPWGLKKGLEKLGVKGAVKAINSATKNLDKASSAIRKALPGKVGKVVDNVLGPKAIKNTFSKPTVGNIAGVTAGHAVTGEDSPISGMLTGVGTSVGVDLAGALLSKGGKKLKSLNRTMKLSDPNMVEATQEQLLHKNLADIRAKHEKTTPKLSSELDQTLKQSSDVKAGKSAIQQNEIKNQELKDYFKDLYKVKGELEKETGQIVNLDKVIKHVQKELNSKTTNRSVENLLKGEKGELIHTIFDNPHNTSTVKSINNILNTTDPMTNLTHASDIIDLTTKNNDLLSMNTSGERAFIKKIGALTRQAEEEALQQTNPQLHKKLQETNKEYAAATPLREAASHIGESKHKPVEAYQKIEKSLSGDAHALEMGGTEEVARNILRHFGKNASGEVDAPKIAKELIGLERPVRKRVLELLPVSLRKEVGNLIENYKVSEVHKPFKGNKLSDVKGFVEGAHPQQKADLLKDKGVQNSIKQAQTLKDLTREAPIGFKTARKGIHGARNALQSMFGKTFEESVPLVVQEIESLASRPKPQSNLARRGLNKIGELSSNIPYTKHLITPKELSKEHEKIYQVTPEEVQLERLRRKNNIK